MARKLPNGEYDTRLTLDRINFELRLRELPLVLHRARGYFYFVFDSGSRFETHSVMVPTLGTLKLAQWTEEASRFAAQLRGESC